MIKGAHYVHQQLKDELVHYLQSQYLGQSEVLLNACNDQMQQPGNLWSHPYIESSPAYESIPHGIETANIPQEIKRLLGIMTSMRLGVYDTPFRHQVEALEAACAGKDLFVSTGTGSGKTECFMWPLVAKMASEALYKDSWSERGIRVIIMYPMNALVADQIGRLRRMLGDSEGKFIKALREVAGSSPRQPQFGMYTGRTPYPGASTDRNQDKALAKSLERLLPTSSDDEYYAELLRNGKIPSKANLRNFIDEIECGNHITSPNDAEMITRFEMQKKCPDILITNYSMLEYMMIRTREDKIWDATRDFYHDHPQEKLLFIIDEAHMYRGSAGGEVALLIHRLMDKLGLDRSRFQFILTTASMPHESEADQKAVQKFACDLTSTERWESFVYLRGHQKDVDNSAGIPIDANMLASIDISRIDESEAARLDELNNFIQQLSPAISRQDNMTAVSLWLYHHLGEYLPFRLLFGMCRGNAVALDELANQIFPGCENAMRALDTMLTIAPLAHDENGNVLFPARMHMLFRGFSGVYACMNEACPKSHEGNGIRLGDVFLSDNRLYCPHCHSHVFELYMDRRCGALFLHGFVSDVHGRQYLWRSKGAFYDEGQMKELHLYLPMAGDTLPAYKKGNARQLRCWLGLRSGFITFNDVVENESEYRELWYSIPAKPRKDNPDLFTFGTCPKCKSSFAHATVQSFSTRGNEPFYNVIQSQFQVQPPANEQKEKDERLPNDGRKVLLFSDSRQKAARLARDMSISSDNWAIRKLFVIALKQLTADRENSDTDPVLDDVYSYMVREAARQNLDLFSNESRAIFRDAQQWYKRPHTERASQRRRSAIRRLPLGDAPQEMQEHFLRLFCMPYNTLMDNGLCYLEPEYETMSEALAILEAKGIRVEDQEFIEVFSAVTRAFLVDQKALCHSIREEWRMNVSQKFGGEDFGVANFDELPTVVADILGCKDQPLVQQAWMDAMKQFMTAGVDNNRRYFLNPARLIAVYDPSHTWYRCSRCAKLSPYMLHNHCQFCGSEQVKATSDFRRESFWRDGVLGALAGEPIRVIDTEEHTAQLGHKDQRNSAFAQTEEYEMRFQDLVRDGEKPIDVLSSTTTMEVGIDIGSLVAVGLRNMPPMRENYQQRAGRAGRRGASLSTIVTFAEGGPHDSYYFANPTPMFRGEPRRPWIDVKSPKLIERHYSLIVLNQVVRGLGYDLDSLSAISFYAENSDQVQSLLQQALERVCTSQLFQEYIVDTNAFYSRLVASLKKLEQKIATHPDQYGEGAKPNQQKSLLDALYEEGIIPTYSFPKDVVSTYIEREDGSLEQQVDRGLDIAISEYAPGRSIVVDKKTYVIGGFYRHNEGRYSFRQTADYLGDPNYVKQLKRCNKCSWFGFAEEAQQGVCPFCHSREVEDIPPMVRPWGFSPRDNRAEAATVVEDYSVSETPLYSTLPDERMLQPISGYKAVRKAVRKDQRIILLNTGKGDKGFTVCTSCGAAVPGDKAELLRGRKRPGNGINQGCAHTNTKHINLGYDFLTDMLVLTFDMPTDSVETSTEDAREWMKKASTTLAEALKKAATILLDIEYDEIQAGYRIRQGEGITNVDVYLYDSLSSGAGYCAQIGESVEELFEKTQELLSGCDCDSACQRCLKHYRNQRIQYDLDRFMAIELLNYGQTQEIPPILSAQEAFDAIMPLRQLLRDEGITLTADCSAATVKRGDKSKHCIVHPALLKRPNRVAGDSVYVSIESLKYAKPFALKKITDAFNG